MKGSDSLNRKHDFHMLKNAEVLRNKDYGSIFNHTRYELMLDEL